MQLRTQQYCAENAPIIITVTLRIRLVYIFLSRTPSDARLFLLYAQRNGNPSQSLSKFRKKPKHVTVAQRTENERLVHKEQPRICVCVQMPPYLLPHTPTILFVLSMISFKCLMIFSGVFFRTCDKIID